jgi:glycosyltransferase involved in cell wall biosynthesis
MNACWTALQAQHRVNVSVAAMSPDSTAPFEKQDEICYSLNLISRDRPKNELYSFYHERLQKVKPDIVVFSGWACPAFQPLYRVAKNMGAFVVMGLDTPAKRSIRQMLAPWALREILPCVDAYVGAGERALQFADYLRGKREASLHSGLYGFSDAFIHLPEHAYPSKCFGYVGRFAPEKGLDILLKAYRDYRAQVNAPWELNCYGTGSLAQSLSQNEGVTNHGFVQPENLPKVLKSISVFILPSRYEPWGVALAEACGSGIPVICTRSVGAGTELVRDYFNGLVVQEQDHASMTRAMIHMHEMSDEQRLKWGVSSQELARPYTASHWAERWYGWMNEWMKTSI